jgi:hypothetical protein
MTNPSGFLLKNLISQFQLYGILCVVCGESLIHSFDSTVTFLVAVPVPRVQSTVVSTDRATSSVSPLQEVQIHRLSYVETSSETVSTARTSVIDIPILYFISQKLVFRKWLSIYASFTFYCRDKLGFVWATCRLLASRLIYSFAKAISAGSKKGLGANGQNPTETFKYNSELQNVRTKGVGTQRC